MERHRVKRKRTRVTSHRPPSCEQVVTDTENSGNCRAAQDHTRAVQCKEMVCCSFANLEFKVHQESAYSKRKCKPNLSSQELRIPCTSPGRVDRPQVGQRARATRLGAASKLVNK